MKRPTKDQYYMQMAHLAATRSTCLRRAVGCVLVNARGHDIATGYNGVAAGLPHCNEQTGRAPSETAPAYVPVYANACLAAKAASGTMLDGCEAIHAEQNALLKCHDVFAIDTCYVTHSPCMTCVKLLMGTSCRRIVFADMYSHNQPARQLWLSRPDRLWEHLF